MKPTKIIYVPWLPFYADGMSLKYFILMREDCKGSVDLVAHEEKHIAQQKGKSFILWAYKYLTDPQFKLTVEVEAYKESIKAGGNLNRCASYLSSDYGLDLTHLEAVLLLTDFDQ